MNASRALLVSLLAALATACTSEAKTSLRVGGAPLDASVTIDDQYLGSFAYVQAHGVALPPGKHRITVEKPGYFPWDRLVEGNGTLIRLDVAMVKIPE
ncbi:MAG TPA: PEGA domain-containing protein [Minicystis sp.]|nr:PEGA domain-containing protein [Minicystis sp.]